MKNIYYLVVMTFILHPLWGQAKLRHNQTQNEHRVQSTSVVNRDLAGTSDGAGGNGLSDGEKTKMLESYIWDPATSEPYKIYLKELVDKVFPDQPSGGFKVTNLKTWYLIPKSLKTIPKKVLGVTQIRGETVQVALQSKLNIIFDKNIYDSMLKNNTNETEGLKEQAKAILHEIVMNLYLVKFETIEALCKRYDCKGDLQTEDKNRDATLLHYISELNKPQSQKPLDAQDYENVRAVTNFLFVQGQKVSSKEIHDFFIEHDFDSRFFGDSEAYPDNSHPENSKNPQFTLQDQILFFDGIRLSKNSGMKCKNPLTNQGYNCEIKVNFSDEILKFPGSEAYSNEQLKSKVFNFSVQNEKGQRVAFGLTPAIDQELQVAESSMNGQLIYSYSKISRENLNAFSRSYKAGDQEGVNVWLINKERTKVIGFLSVSFVFVGLKYYEKVENGRNLKCTKEYFTVLNDLKGDHQSVIAFTDDQSKNMVELWYSSFLSIDRGENCFEKTP